MIDKNCEIFRLNQEIYTLVKPSETVCVWTMEKKSKEQEYIIQRLLNKVNIKDKFNKSILKDLDLSLAKIAQFD